PGPSVRNQNRAWRWALETAAQVEVEPETSFSSRTIERRNLLKAGAAGLAAAALVNVPGLGRASAAGASPAVSAGVGPGPLAWVWRFGPDGSPEQVRDILAAHGLGVLLKTFDGVN